MIIRVLDPTNEMQAAGGKQAVRPTTLKGKTVGFISNGKEGTKGYFAALERQFREVFGVALMTQISCRPMAWKRC